MRNLTAVEASSTLSLVERTVRRLAGALLPPLLLIAGCGSLSVYSPRPATDAFSIRPSTSALNTSGQVRFTARLATGGAAPVTWSIAQGQNDPALGQGRIDATGLYTPPAALSRDTIQVLITAQLQGDASNIASAVLTVAPGFLQPLSPETATLAPSATLPITGEIAEVNGGAIHWSLTREGRDINDGSAGTILPQGCLHSSRNYTTCTALYTAPASWPSSGGSLSIVGKIDSGPGSESSSASAPVSVRLSSEGITSTPLLNQALQAGAVQLGASGGNNSDYDSDSDGNVLECCGGTLGALVASQGGSQYILSNNHVLAESDQASTGDTILQPGLIDSGCSAHPERGAGRPVAALKYFVPLAAPGSNVDAALAQVNPGAVQADGAILQLGSPPANGAITGTTLGAAPPAGGKGETIGAGSFAGGSPLQVVKSGRTTGLTCSTVDAIDLDVEVDYFKDCAETQPYLTKTFTGQFGIPGSGFADSGDSGALIVDARNAEPVGLLFATGSDGAGTGYSVANPIRDVLAELGSQAGQQFSVVGGAEHSAACLNYDADPQTVRDGSLQASLDTALQQKAASALRTATGTLVDRANGILGAALGRSADNPREPAIILYVDEHDLKAAETDKNGQSIGAPINIVSNIPSNLPLTIGDVRTAVVPTDAQGFESDSAPQKRAPQVGIHLSSEALNSAAEVQHRFAKQLMADPAIFGVGVTASHDSPGEAALLVLVDIHRTPRATPEVLGGLRVRYVYLDRFHVTKSKYAAAKSPSCAPPLKSGPWSAPEPTIR